MLQRMKSPGRRITATIAVLLTALSLALGCGPSAPAAKDPKAPRAADGPLDIAALAKELDPGEVEPLLSGMPASVEAWFPARKVTGALLAEQTKQIIEFWKDAKGEFRADDFTQLIGLLQGLDMLWRQRETGECELACWAALEKINMLIDLPEYRDSESMIRQMQVLWVRSVTGPAAADEVASWLGKVFDRVPLHRRRAMAHILRTAPKSPEALDVLRHLSMIADLQEGRYDQARRLAEAVVEREKKAKVSDLLRVARSCYRALDTAAGDDWLSRSRELAKREADKDTDFSFTEQLQGYAKRSVELAKAGDIEQRLTRAEATYGLGRHGDAGKQYAQLKKDHPRDARPVTGLALVAMTKYHMSEVRSLIAQARKLSNKDRNFYEVAIGTWFTVFLKTVLPQVLADPDRFGPAMAEHLPELRADVAGLRAYDPAMADLMALVVDSGMKAIMLKGKPEDERRAPLRALLAKALRQALELRQRYPEVPHMHRLALALTFFEYDIEARKRTATAPAAAAASDVTLELLQRYVLLSAAMLEQDLELIDELVRQVGALARAPEASYETRAFHADLYALIARMRSSRDHWQRAELLYEELLKDVPPQQRARLLNNIGVSLFELGNAGNALQAWQQSQQLGAKYKMPALNTIANTLEGDQRIELLRKVAEAAEREEVKHQAKLWLIALTVDDPEEAKLQAKQARDELVAGSDLGPPNDAATGGVFVRSLNFNVGYSTVDKLLVNIEVPSELWLVIPAPPAGTKPKPAPEASPAQ